MKLIKWGMLAIIASGCAGKVHTTVDPRPAISTAAKTVTTTADGIGRDAADIDSNADRITATGEPTVIPFVGNIKNDTSDLRKLQGQLSGVTANLSAAQSQITSLESTISKQANQITDLQSAAKAGLKNAMLILSVLCVCGIGIAAALAYSGAIKLAVTVGIGSGATLVAAILVGQYAVWLAVGGGVLLLGGIAWLVWTHRQQLEAATVKPSI